MSDSARRLGVGSSRPASAPTSPWQRYGWLMSVVWLVFLYFPVRELLAAGPSTPWVVLGWVSLGLFTIAYLVGFTLGLRAGWRQPTRLVWGLLIAAAISALLTVPAIGWGAVSLVPFLMAYSTYATTVRAHWVATVAGIAVVAIEVVTQAITGEQPAWVLLGIVLLMAAVNTINTWLIDRSANLDVLRIDLATSEERESVARDVHDLLGHSLTVIKLKAELATRLIDVDASRARDELQQIIQLSGEALAGVRGTVTGLRGGELAAQIEASRRAFAAAGIVVRVDGEVADLSAAQTLTASWILREATTNVIRHADATEVKLSIAPGVLIVEDNGRGMLGRSGNGMRGMAERAAAAAARLRVSAGESGRGTRVSVTW